MAVIVEDLFSIWSEERKEIDAWVTEEHPVCGILAGRKNRQGAKNTQLQISYDNVGC